MSGSFGIRCLTTYGLTNGGSLKRRAFHCLALTGSIFFAVRSSARDRPSPTELGAMFFRLFDSGQYGKTAAFFHYPEDYTTRQREEDAQGIVRFLESVSATAGKLRDRQTQSLGGAFIMIGIGAGDVPYWTAHAEFANGIQTNYVVGTQEGPLGISLNWVSAKGNWELRNVVFNIPSDRKGAEELVQRLAKSLLPTT
jgi:hypothetical protein